MNDSAAKSLLLIVRHSPYGGGLARASVDFALACGAFEQNVTLLFSGAGVLQLKEQQDGNALGLKDIRKQLSSLPLYDIESVYIDAEASERYNVSLDNSPVEARALDAAAMRALIATHNHVITL